MSGNNRNDQGSSPKYAAKVPESICTPDVVETSRLGRLEFFDGMPSAETVRKVYDQLDFSRCACTLFHRGRLPSGHRSGERLH